MVFENSDTGVVSRRGLLRGSVVLAGPASPPQPPDGRRPPFRHPDSSMASRPATRSPTA
ncbi:hypothetical protein P9209_04430 [Prescottella defluvii]|nr:hypothetical protein P9209_04430 [Prescottella defluvii]